MGVMGNADARWEFPIYPIYPIRPIFPILPIYPIRPIYPINRPREKYTIPSLLTCNACSTPQKKRKPSFPLILFFG